MKRLIVDRFGEYDERNVARYNQKDMDKLKMINEELKSVVKAYHEVIQKFNLHSYKDTLNKDALIQISLEVLKRAGVQM